MDDYQMFSPTSGGGLLERWRSQTWKVQISIVMNVVLIIILVIMIIASLKPFKPRGTADYAKKYSHAKCEEIRANETCGGGLTLVGPSRSLIKKNDYSLGQLCCGTPTVAPPA